MSSCQEIWQTEHIYDNRYKAWSMPEGGRKVKISYIGKLTFNLISCPGNLNYDLEKFRILFRKISNFLLTRIILIYHTLTLKLGGNGCVSMWFYLRWVKYAQ